MEISGPGGQSRNQLSSEQLILTLERQLGVYFWEFDFKEIFLLIWKNSLSKSQKFSDGQKIDRNRVIISLVFDQVIRIIVQELVLNDLY